MQADESELVERSSGRDISAFNKILERYQLQVFNLFTRILGDRATAEDVAQETFISAFRAIDGFWGGTLRGWLLRIASNRNYDSIRPTKRLSENSLYESLENPSFQPASQDLSRPESAETPRPSATLDLGRPRDLSQGQILIHPQCEPSSWPFPAQPYKACAAPALELCVGGRWSLLVRAANSQHCHLENNEHDK